MSRFIDLTGQKIGRLLVIEKLENYNKVTTKQAIWKCECECGNFVVVLSNRLRKGIPTSCGCYSKENLKKNKHLSPISQQEEMIGRKFGRWTVIRRDKNIKKHSAYLCQCECGNQKVIRAFCLKKGKSQSCGCVNRPGKRSGRPMRDLTGQKFGRLRVIQPLEQKIIKSYSYHRLWITKCDCGNIKIVPTYSLLNSTKSCGCLRKQNCSVIGKHMHKISVHSKKIIEQLLSQKVTQSQLQSSVELIKQ